MSGLSPERFDTTVSLPNFLNPHLHDGLHRLQPNNKPKLTTYLQKRQNLPKAAAGCQQALVQHSTRVLTESFGSEVTTGGRGRG